MAKIFLVCSAVSGFISVALGAFAAHGLKDYFSDASLATFYTGADYQMLHSLALLGVAMLAARNPDSNALTISGWAFVVGLILFSGSLYLLAFSGITIFAAITPLGGMAFLLGWASLFVFAITTN